MTTCVDFTLWKEFFKLILIIQTEDALLSGTEMEVVLSFSLPLRFQVTTQISVTSCMISSWGAWPKGIIHVLYPVEGGQKERMREWRGRGKGGTKRKRYLIMYAFSCEGGRKECECVTGGKKGRETLKSGTVCECVCECVFCDLLPGKAPSD